MMNQPNPIVSMKWLLARMYEPDLVIADCRFALGKPESGREAYEAAHVPGAVYLDLERDLSAPVGEHGGRHPLPDPAELEAALRRAGIGPDSRVVAYDDQGGAMASRLWWLLRWLGHDAVYVMDQGFSAWQAAGYPVTDATRVVVPGAFRARVRPELLADVDAVRAASRTAEPEAWASAAGAGAESGSAAAESAPLLIDSREPRRYAGLEEPIDRAAGHIPGAVNRFWKGVLDKDGRWKSGDALSAALDGIPQDRELIVYCGSGVTACPNVLGLQAAGYGNVRLYAGSWSDWISYSENPVATGKE
ncbi:sulfurtransferase [Paenibacillus sp. FSL W8-1187]|uniref:sulfurtransferase n=1 Tax=Paenibacillus sp. FSL W8-1187 TaxID=2975339 RepID=UPI0030D874CB